MPSIRYDVTPWPLVLAWLDEMRSSNVKPASLFAFETWVWRLKSFDPQNEEMVVNDNLKELLGSQTQDVISFDEALTSSCRSQRWKRVAPSVAHVNFGGFVFVQFVSMFSRCLWCCIATKAEIWRRLETSMVESDVMLHSSFMSRVGPDIAGRFFRLDVTRLSCPATPSLMNSHGLQEATGGEWQRMLQRMYL